VQGRNGAGGGDILFGRNNKHILGAVKKILETEQQRRGEPCPNRIIFYSLSFGLGNLTGSDVHPLQTTSTVIITS
jgi:hypothetical protein